MLNLSPRPGEPDRSEPTAAERERAMGFPEGVTAVVGVTDEERCELLGRTMDLYCVEALLASLHALALGHPGYKVPDMQGPRVENNLSVRRPN